MPLCPRCGAAHRREDEVCGECGKRLRTVPGVAADQTSLSFPTCVEGPDGCEGNLAEGPDGRLRCIVHQTLGHPVSERRAPTCVEGADVCAGTVQQRDDGRWLCEHHHDLTARPRWRRILKRWF